MKKILAALFVFVAANCFALEITTHDGKTYHDCTVKAFERDGVRIMHRDGTAFLDFDVLPSALQKQYGWTEEKSAARKALRTAEAEKQRAAAEAQRKAQEEARLAAEKAKADDAARIARNEQRIKEMAATKDTLQLAKEKRIEREAEERKEEAETKRALWLYGIFSTLSFLYFLPSVIGRSKRNFAALFVLNLLGFAAWAGWVIEFFHFVKGTGGLAGIIASIIFACGVFLLPFAIVVWLAAIVWSFMDDARPQTVVQTVVVQSPPQQHAPHPVAVPRAVARAPLPPNAPPPSPPA